MSTTKNTGGRQSGAVYRRRRLVVGLGLLAVLAIIFLIIVKPGSSSGEPAGTTSPAASTTATDAAPKATPKPAAEGGPCTAASVQVEAITDADKYEPGKLPQLSLSVTNTGATSCTINAGTSKQVFTITSGKDVYWTSTDCQTESADAEVLLEPGEPVSSSTPVAWERVRSAKDTCDAATRDAAPAGGASYHLRVSVDGIESETPKQFLLY
ncbi:hypothetical protein [Cryobacterium tagatosivorans]|uniref:DUF4232 domain-containing protein n=1 Tax=Cryobacterium tagatosivorans TaxID=1259199 RepID=A0A4V3I6M0_9MICO|nr:hypothetical protein [Cryobacterium tagatosivorans]TFB52482.1 hypothetical protein E3O23_06285 [Cryobacterium tagatosivorans]